LLLLLLLLLLLCVCVCVCECVCVDRTACFTLADAGSWAVAVKMGNPATPPHHLARAPMGLPQLPHKQKAPMVYRAGTIVHERRRSPGIREQLSERWLPSLREPLLAILGHNIEQHSLYSGTEPASSTNTHPSPLYPVHRFSARPHHAYAHHVPFFDGVSSRPESPHRRHRRPPSQPPPACARKPTRTHAHARTCMHEHTQVRPRPNIAENQEVSLHPLLQTKCTTLPIAPFSRAHMPNSSLSPTTITCRPPATAPDPASWQLECPASRRPTSSPPSAAGPSSTGARGARA
jgi:hypothetical protein